MSLRWYVVHAYSNFEHKVSESLKERVKRAGLEAKFGEQRKASLVWRPQNTVPVEDEAGEKILKLIGALEENGILCITTCGRGMRYAHENIFRTIDDEGYQRICDQLKERPFGYSPYRHRYDGYDREEKYGMAFIYPAWIQEHVLTPDIQVLHMREKAWHGAQDVWCLINRPLSSWYHWAKS